MNIVQLMLKSDAVLDARGSYPHLLSLSTPCKKTRLHKGRAGHYDLKLTKLLL